MQICNSLTSLSLAQPQIPGAIEVSNCIAKWNIEPHAWQLASKMEIFIHQLDQYGNLVSGLYPFDAEVVERDTNLSIPISDLHFEEVDAGIQLFSFSNLEPGNFLLTIYDTKHNKSISNMPYVYTVFVGKVSCQVSEILFQSSSSFLLDLWFIAVFMHSLLFDNLSLLIGTLQFFQLPPLAFYLN